MRPEDGSFPWKRRANSCFKSTVPQVLTSNSRSRNATEVSRMAAGRLQCRAFLTRIVTDPNVASACSTSAGFTDAADEFPGTEVALPPEVRTSSTTCSAGALAMTAHPLWKADPYPGHVRSAVSTVPQIGSHYTRIFLTARPPRMNSSQLLLALERFDPGSYLFSAPTSGILRIEGEVGESPAVVNSIRTVFWRAGLNGSQMAVRPEPGRARPAFPFAFGASSTTTLYLINQFTHERPHREGSSSHRAFHDQR